MGAECEAAGKEGGGVVSSGLRTVMHPWSKQHGLLRSIPFFASTITHTPLPHHLFLSLCLPLCRARKRPCRLLLLP